MRRLPALLLCGLLLGLGCGEGPSLSPPGYRQGVPRQSASLALSADGRLLVVANPDADSISVLDPQTRTLLRELPLGPRPQPQPDGRFAPAQGPRSVDLSPDGSLAYVACQQSGRLVTVSTASGELKSSLWLGAEPVAVLVHPGGQALYVSVYQSGEVVRLPLDPSGLPDGSAQLRQKTTDRPWGLALSSDGNTLYATRFLRAPGLDRFDPQSLALRGQSPFADAASRGDRLLAHGVPRGLYGPVVRPGTGEVWVPHLLLATDTAQPALDFESTVFPAISIRSADGQPVSLLSVDSRLPGVDGQLADVVSGPRALAFTPDGKLALLVNMSSEDVLVVDAARPSGPVQVGLLRPLPGDLPEGIVISADGLHAYIDQRASTDVAVLAIDQAATLGPPLRLDGPPIPRLQAADPMPAPLRLGQRLFYSANSAELPTTKNFWVACASCHLEGRSDAVTWLFSQGPRDTPSNAGGSRDTGFLLRNAGRNTIGQYDETIRIEQGGDLDYSRPADRALLDALAAYVDHAIPPAVSPERTADGQWSPAAQRGQAVFADLGCGKCHSGPRYTDSGAGNPSLDLAGPVLLHDVGTCASQPTPDQPVVAHDGKSRPACQFDTPSLNGLFDSPPYLHDGSADTLDAVVARKVAFLKLTPPTPSALTDLLTFLRSL